MQDLQLVGFTTDRRGLIFRTTTGPRDDSFVVPLTDELLSLVSTLATGGDDIEEASGPEVESTPASAAPQPVTRPRSRLSVRDIQARLRAGETPAQVAVEAGAEEEWIERFAPPVRAEQRRIVECALGAHLQRARGRPSAVPLRRAVGMAMADRGIAFTVAAFEAAWSARLLGQDRWAVEFGYRHRGQRTARWTYDAATGELTTSDRTAAQLGYVADTARRGADVGDAIDGVIGDPAAAPIGVPEPAAPAATAPSRKKAAAQKAAAKKAAAKKETPRSTRKKPTAKKSTPKKKAAKRKAATGTTVSKKAAPRKAAARKAAAQKSTRKKAVTKKAAAKKAVTKKAAAKKAVTKKAAAKKAAAKKAASTKMRTKKAAPERSATVGSDGVRSQKAGPPAPPTRPVPPTASEDAPNATAPTPSGGVPHPPVADRPGDVDLARAPLAPVPNGNGRPPALERVPDAPDVVDTTDPARPGATPPPPAPAPAADPADARRARAVERAAPTVRFRSGSAVPVRAANPARRPAADGAARPATRRRGQLRAR